MTALFWTLSAAMTLLAVALLVVPLMRVRQQQAVDRRRFNVEVYRDRVAELEQEHSGGGLSDAELAASKAELERELLADVSDMEESSASARRGPSGFGAGTAVALALLVPGLAVVLYMQLGEPRSFSVPGAIAGLPGGQPGQLGPDGQPLPSIEQMADVLAMRLEDNPDDAEGWTMLGRTYHVMERFADARDAFARAVALTPNEPDLLARYAEAMALAQGGRLGGEPLGLLQQVLEMDPDNPSGLWLMGMAARQQGALEASLAYWERLRPQLTGEEAATLDQLIAETREALASLPPPDAAGGTPLAAVGTPPAEPALDGESPGASPEGGGAPAPAADEAALEVRVDISPAMREAVSPEDTVFIFARAAEGPRMPLAIVRTTVANLPAEVTLDDSMAMTPAMTLSAFPQITVGARISRTGNAIPQAGDLEGLSEPVSPEQPGPVQVTIDRRI